MKAMTGERLYTDYRPCGARYWPELVDEEQAEWRALSLKVSAYGLDKHEAGYKAGIDEGRKEGYSVGHDDGWSEGYDEGIEEGESA